MPRFGWGCCGRFCGRSGRANDGGRSSLIGYRFAKSICDCRFAAGVGPASDKIVVNAGNARYRSGGGGGGTGGSTGSGSGPNTGGLPPMAGETLGFPNWFPFPQGNIWGTLLPIDPSCEFGPCVPLGSGYATGVRGNGTPESPFTISVYVWAGMHLCGGFWCDEHGNLVGPAPREIQGIHPTNIEFDILLGGFYLSRINSNPFLRIGPGFVKGGRRILRVVSGGPGVGWWWHIWDGPTWPF